MSEVLELWVGFEGVDGYFATVVIESVSTPWRLLFPEETCDGMVLQLSC